MKKADVSYLRRFRGWIFQILSARGFYVFSDRSLPYGINLKLDIIRCGGEIKSIFDVGANIGQSVERFVQYWPNARIFCFEPVESTFRQLVKNTRGFPHVRCEKLALGSSCGNAVIWLKQSSPWNSLKIEVNQPENSIGKAEEVSIVTLDNYCAENRVECIDLLKIDVEGYEIEVLQGARRMLTSHAIRFIYVETTFLRSDVQHTHIAKLLDFLEPMDYRLLAIYDKKLEFDDKRHPRFCRWCDALFRSQA